MKFLCPVCGYPEMEEPPERFAICSCCGTEFGNDDFVFDTRDRERRLAELRAEWLAAGAAWFDESTPPPMNWNPWTQVMHQGLALVVSSTASAARAAEPGLLRTFPGTQVPKEPRVA